VRNANLLRRVLEYARSFDIPVVVHPEDADLADGGLMHEGEVATRIGLQASPGAAESVMVARDILLCELTGGRLHFSHLSVKDGLDMVSAAKARGAKVTAEASALHFSLTDEDVAAANYDPDWKVKPPLRTAADVEAVKERLYDGTIDVVVSDHRPHHRDEKELDFSLAPFGAVGLETTVSLAVDRLLHGKVIGLMQLIRLFSTAPARIFKLPGGNLKVGAPADLTLLDLRSWRTADAGAFASKARNTPLHGLRLRGGPAMTIVGGRIVWQAPGAPEVERR
jgi:dihydroorotase